MPDYSLPWPEEWRSQAIAAPNVPAEVTGPQSLAAAFDSPPESPVLRERGERGRTRSHTEIDNSVVPHQYTFQGIYNTVQRLYPQRHWDEALRRSYDDTLAMRRDPFIHELLRARQMPVAQLPGHCEPDDPDDPEQQAVCERLQAIVETTPRLTMLRISLLEADFYGKAGAHFKLGRKRIKGWPAVTVTHWTPVNGDKIVWEWGMTPALIVHTTWNPDRPANFRFSDRGKVLLLDRPEWRQRYIIHQFEPTDMDYMFESEKATAVGGLGLRDRLYWAWWLRQELQSYWFDGLQTISTDGLLIGYYTDGNSSEKESVREGLKAIHRDKIGLLPRRTWQQKDSPAFEHIEPADVAYQELREGITYYDDIMRRIVLGQNLSSESDSTGLGSKVAELHDDTLTRIIRYDAKALDETITRDLISVLLAENTFEYRGKRLRGSQLPFNVRWVSEIDRPDVQEKMEAAQMFAGLGGRLDLEQLGTDLGLPLDPAGQPSAAEQEQQQMMQQMGGMNDGSQGTKSGPEGPAQAAGQPGAATQKVKPKPQMATNGKASANGHPVS